MKIRAVVLLLSPYGVTPYKTSPYKTGDAVEFYNKDDHQQLGVVTIVAIHQLSIVIQLNYKEHTAQYKIALPDSITFYDALGRDALKLQIDSIGNIFDTNDPVVDAENPSLN